LAAGKNWRVEAELRLLYAATSTCGAFSFDSLQRFAIAGFNLLGCFIEAGMGRKRRKQETDERHEEDQLLHAGIKCITDANPITKARCSKRLKEVGMENEVHNLLPSSAACRSIKSRTSRMAET
jgi:hypothetical protein